MQALDIHRINRLQHHIWWSRSGSLCKPVESHCIKEPLKLWS